MSVAVMNPPAEVSTPIEVRFGTSQPQRRVTVFFRGILAIPQLIVVGVIGYGAAVVVFLGWFAALFTGRLPAPFARFLTGYMRWYTRVIAYEYLLTDVYPPFSLDPDPVYPVDLTVTTGRLNRAAVFFRILLVVPVSILSTALAFGWQVLSFFFWIITLVKGRMPDSIFGATAAVIRFQARVNGYLYLLTSVYPGGMLGDTGPGGVAVEVAESGTPYAPFAPMPPPPPQAWGVAAGIAAPVPPPPPAPYSAGAAPPPATWADVPPPPATGPDPSAPVPPPSAEPHPLDGFPGSGTVPPAPGADVPPPPLPPPPPVGTVPPPPGGAGTLPPPLPPPPSPGSYAPPPPVAGTPAVPDAGPGRVWPLFLTSAARTLTIVLLVLGAVGFAAYVALVATLASSSSLTNSLQASLAGSETQLAYEALQTPTDTFVSASKSCRDNATSTSGELQCLQSADATYAKAIDAYVTALGLIDYPSSAQVQASAAVAAGKNASALLISLSTAPDAQTYTSISTSSAFSTGLHALDSTYNDLIDTLNNS